MSSHLIPTNNSENPGAGRAFEEYAAKVLTEHYGKQVLSNLPVAIGDPPKNHRFDFATADLTHVGEAKNYSWTNTGNVPSAKMGFCTQALFYLSFIPSTSERFLVMRRATHPRRNETLAEYFSRTYEHLLGGVHVLEIDVETGTMTNVTDALRENR